MFRVSEHPHSGRRPLKGQYRLLDLEIPHEYPNGVDLGPILGVHVSLGPLPQMRVSSSGLGGLVYDVVGFSGLNGVLPPS